MKDTLMDMSKRGKVAREAASAKIILEAEGMTLEEAAKWVDKNCTDETVSRLRSRAAAKALFDEVRRQEELINDLYGDERETCAQMLEMRDSELLLMAGEMTAQELRTVQAVLAQRARAIRMRSHAEMARTARLQRAASSDCKERG